jgi:hypothetical protein
MHSAIRLPQAINHLLRRSITRLHTCSSTQSQCNPYTMLCTAHALRSNACALEALLAHRSNCPLVHTSTHPQTPCRTRYVYALTAYGEALRTDPTTHTLNRPLAHPLTRTLTYFCVPRHNRYFAALTAHGEALLNEPVINCTRTGVENSLLAQARATLDRTYSLGLLCVTMPSAAHRHCHLNAYHTHSCDSLPRV